jgi:hypothetical protein
MTLHLDGQLELQYGGQAFPSAAVLADILRMPADEIDLRRIRLAVLLVLPLTSGLLVAMATALTAKEPRP